MDRSAVEAIVGRELGPLMDALGVSWWRVAVEYGPIRAIQGNLPVADGFEAVARCDRNAPYNRATITIDPVPCDDAAEVLEHLRHELIHLVLAPLDLYRQFCAAFVESGSPADHHEEVAWRHAIEQAVIGVERIWKCAPPYWAARAEGRAMPKKGGGGAGPGGKRVTVKSASKDAIGTNVAKLIKAGVKRDQAVAEAISIQREAAKAQGKKPAYPKKKKKGS